MAEKNMAKPRIFISSTFYDLKQIRSDLDNFIESLGYETIRNEDGEIPYGNNDALEEYCYKEIKNADILISIIIIVGAFVLLRAYFTSHPSDKYHNDSWKDERKKKRSKNDRYN